MTLPEGNSASRQPMLRAPAAIWWLLAILALIYLVTAVTPLWVEEVLLINFAFIPARYSSLYLGLHGVDPGSWLAQAIPFVTYLFLHADFTHLAINCLWLLAFGPVVARRLGTPLFLALFFLCALAGSLTHLATNWGSDAPVIGASGAISGLMGASIRMLRGRINPYGSSLAPLFSRPIITFTLFWLGANLLAGLSGVGMDGQVRLIAWQAHLGGYFAGLIFVSVFDRMAKLPQIP